MSKNQRQRKIAISDALTKAAGNIFLTGLFAVALIGLPLYGLHALFSQFEYGALVWIATALVLTLIPAFLGGFYFGKVKTDGFLAGVDTAMDKLSQAVDMRDNSKIRVTHAAKAKPREQPNFNVYLPQQGQLPGVPVSHRQLSQDEVIDL